VGGGWGMAAAVSLSVVLTCMDAGMDAEMEARIVGGGGLPDDGSTLVTIAKPILPSPTNPNLVQAEAEGLVSAKRTRGLRAKVRGRWWSAKGGSGAD
jgi:hypothetical protein